MYETSNYQCKNTTLILQRTWFIENVLNKYTDQLDKVRQQ